MLDHLVKSDSRRVEGPDIHSRIEALEAQGAANPENKPKVFEWEFATHGEVKQPIKTCIRYRDYIGTTTQWQAQVQVKANELDEGPTNEQNFEKNWRTGKWQYAIVKIDFVDRGRRTKFMAKNAASSIATTLP